MTDENLNIMLKDKCTDFEPLLFTRTYGAALCTVLYAATVSLSKNHIQDEHNGTLRNRGG